MQSNPLEQNEQVRAAVGTLQRILGGALLAVYLHGSAVSGGLRPQSDIDLLVVVDPGMTDDQRNELLTALLHISGRHPALPESTLRCIDVTAFRVTDISPVKFPARADFTYGEWLRKDFENGRRPMPVSDPEFTLILAQARRDAVELVGPRASEILPEIPAGQIRQAMRDTLPRLMTHLKGDERNTLLTLARMWLTASTGDFASKDTAASWAIQRLAARDVATLEYARKAHLGEIVDIWGDREADARRLAEKLRRLTIDIL